MPKRSTEYGPMCDSLVVNFTRVRESSTTKGNDTDVADSTATSQTINNNNKTTLTLVSLDQRIKKIEESFDMRIKKIEAVLFRD